MSRIPPPASVEEMRDAGMEPAANGGWRIADKAPTDDLHDALVGPDDGVRLTSLADVKIRRARYAWAGRMAMGTITILAGVPGLGKTHLATYLGARVTRGQLPGDLYGTPADVVVASAEDALSFTIAPRFIAAGADLSRVHSISVHRDGTDLGIAIPDDLDGVRAAVAGMNARAFIIDPFLAHLPVRIDGYKDQHVRVALAPLARLAEELDVAVILIMHLNKRETTDLFSRIGGSGGFLAAARSAFLVAADPEDESVRVAAHGKHNLGPEAPAVRFRLEPHPIPNPDPNDEEPIDVASVAIIGEADLRIDELLQRGEKPGKRTEASAWLARVLTDGPMPVEWIRNAANEEGFGWRTIERAKAELDVRADRLGGIGASGRWEWSLP